MVAIGVSAVGCTQPIFAPAGTKINGTQYKEMIEQSYFPQMSAIAQMRGKGHLRSFQQDNAPSHKTRDVLDSIKKHCPKSFLHWPACSPDLSVLGYFAWGEFKEFLMGMDNAPITVLEIRTSICMAANSLDQCKLNSAIQNLIKLCEKCLDVDGLRFEQML